MMLHPSNRCAVRRRGVALLMAVALIATLTVILTVVTLQIVGQRRTLDLRERQLQAKWLTRAGVELAAAHLLESSAAFAERKFDLLPETTLRVALENSGPDYSVNVAARVGLEDKNAVERTTRVRLRRAEKNGTIGLERLPTER